MMITKILNKLYGEICCSFLQILVISDFIKEMQKNGLSLVWITYRYCQCPPVLFWRWLRVPSQKLSSPAYKASLRAVIIRKFGRSVKSLPSQASPSVQKRQNLYVTYLLVFKTMFYDETQAYCTTNKYREHFCPFTFCQGV